jgi:ribonuclease T1
MSPGSGKLYAMTSRNRLTIAAALLTLSVALTGCGKSHTTSTTSTSTSTTSTGTTSAARPSAAAAGSVCQTKLPSQAQDTLSLIAKHGPFPYRTDGIVFENRENRLPKQRAGYYHEYTVVTPGSGDRGTRRIVTGSSGEEYWTGDHYSTFQQVNTGC